MLSLLFLISVSSWYKFLSPLPLSPCHTYPFQIKSAETAPHCLDCPEKLCQDTLAAELRNTAHTWVEASKATALARTSTLLSQFENSATSQSPGGAPAASQLLRNRSSASSLQPRPQPCAALAHSTYNTGNWKIWSGTIYLLSLPIILGPLPSTFSPFPKGKGKS